MPSVQWQQLQAQRSMLDVEAVLDALAESQSSMLAKVEETLLLSYVHNTQAQTHASTIKACISTNVLVPGLSMDMLFGDGAPLSTNGPSAQVFEGIQKQQLVSEVGGREFASAPNWEIV